MDVGVNTGGMRWSDRHQTEAAAHLTGQAKKFDQLTKCGQDWALQDARQSPEFFDGIGGTGQNGIAACQQEDWQIPVVTGDCLHHVAPVLTRSLDCGQDGHWSALGEHWREIFATRHGADGHFEKIADVADRLGDAIVILDDDNDWLAFAGQ